MQQHLYFANVLNKKKLDSTHLKVSMFVIREGEKQDCLTRSSTSQVLVYIQDGVVLL